MAKAPATKPEPEGEVATEQQPPVVMTPPQYREGGSHAPPTQPKNQLSFGEKAVGLTFNPSGDADVTVLKQAYARIIDLCHSKRGSLMQGSEAHRLGAIAITQAQDAQMWAVKAATWKD